MKALQRKRRICLVGKAAMVLVGLTIAASSAYAWANWGCNGGVAFILVLIGLEFCWVGFTSRTR